MNFRWKCRRSIWISIILLATHVDKVIAEPNIPTTELELRDFLQNVSEHTEEISEWKGAYALPNTYVVNGEEVSLIEFDRGTLRFVEKGGKRKYVFVRPIESVERLLGKRKLGELVGDIHLFIDADPWKTLFPGFPISGESKSSSAMKVPLNIAYFKDEILYFFSGEFPLKMTEELVMGREKPIGDHGPVTFTITGVNVLLPGPDKVGRSSITLPEKDH